MRLGTGLATRKLDATIRASDPQRTVQATRPRIPAPTTVSELSVDVGGTVYGVFVLGVSGLDDDVYLV